MENDDSRGAPSFDPFEGVLSVDFETASAVDIDNGSWAYSRHESTRVYVACFAYATCAGDYSFLRWFPGRPLDRRIADFVRAGGPLLAWNCAFEKAIWANVLIPAHDWPVYELAQWRDAQALSAAANLPVALEGAARALGCKTQKDTEGAALMRKMAAAVEFDGDKWVYPMATPANLERLAQYCELDVGATLDAWWKLPPLSVTESLVWRLDQRMNERGVLLDQEFGAKLKRMAEVRKRRLSAAVFAETVGELANSTAAPSLKVWLRGHGVKLPTIAKRKKDGTWHRVETAGAAAIKELAGDPTLPPVVRAVLANRVEANKATSLAKLDRMAPMVGGDGRLRHALQFCGAHTGRWSSSGLQLHNLPKTKLEGQAMALARMLAEAEDLNGLELVERRPLEVLSQMLRSVVVAPPGREFIGADYSAIEARVCAWLAGQEDTVAFFHEFDAAKRRGEKPRDFYMFTAASIDSDDRQLGKVAALALQYGMGDLKFAATAAGWGVPLALVDARRTKKAWRAANSCIVDCWADLEDAARTAIAQRGRVVHVGRLRIYCDSRCMFLVLPSGRSLRYWQPRVVHVERTAQVVDDEGRIHSRTYETDEVQFFKVGKDKKTMERESTYGGKLAENATQAVARDLLAEGLLRVDAAPYLPVLHVHDSVVAEVAPGAGDVVEFCDRLSTVPAWGAGCPVAAAGYRGRRFQG